MDASIISRIVKHQIVLHNNHEIPLTDLFPKRSYLLGLKVIEFIREHDPLLGDEKLAGLLKQHFEIEITRRYVTYIRRRMGIPSLRERGNGLRLLDTGDSVAIIHSLRNLLPNYPQTVESMKLA